MTVIDPAASEERHCRAMPFCSSDFFMGCLVSVAPCHKIRIISCVAAAWIHAERCPTYHHHRVLR
jgi:hypothetical protein